MKSEGLGVPAWDKLWDLPVAFGILLASICNQHSFLLILHPFLTDINAGNTHRECV